MISVNENTTKYVDKLLDREEELGVKSYYLENKATVIDCGVSAAGSIGAGILFADVSLAGLGKVSVVPGIIDSYYINFAQVYVDRPAIACLGSQKPAWKLKSEGFVGTGFGPARAISQKPKNIYAAINYVDDAETAVLNIETQALPAAKDLDYIAKQCSTDPECVVALVARPNSIAGSVVNGTRVVEWAMNRLFQLGYDVQGHPVSFRRLSHRPGQEGRARVHGRLVRQHRLLWHGLPVRGQQERYVQRRRGILLEVIRKKL